MNNVWKLTHVVKYISNKCLELSQTISPKDMNRVYELGMKIIWMCDNLLRYNSRDVINSMDSLDLDRLRESKTRSYTRKFESYYKYLCEWRECGLVKHKSVENLEYPPEANHEIQIRDDYRFDLDYF